LSAVTFAASGSTEAVPSLSDTSSMGDRKRAWSFASASLRSLSASAARRNASWSTGATVARGAAGGVGATTGGAGGTTGGGTGITNLLSAGGGSTAAFSTEKPCGSCAVLNDSSPPLRGLFAACLLSDAYQPTPRTTATRPNAPSPMARLGFDAGRVTVSRASLLSSSKSAAIGASKIDQFAPAGVPKTRVSKSGSAWTVWTSG
jgi:hypothetical protein